MDIALAFDENYADQAQVAVESILLVHESRRPVTLWLLTTAAVRAQRQEAFQRQVRGRGAVNFLAVPDDFRGLPLSDHPNLEYISAGMYLRLFLPDLLPPSVERFLYLDVDILCVDDLSPLWELSLDQYVLAATRDAFTIDVSYRGGLPGVEGLMEPTAPYFNSGVMLVHAPLWREAKVSEHCFDYIHQHRGRLRFPDQDALNLVTYRQWLRLPREWNYMISQRFEPTYYNPPRREIVRIMHFAGRPKLWDRDFRAGLRRDRYVALTRSLGLPVPDYHQAEPEVWGPDDHP